MIGNEVEGEWQVFGLCIGGCSFGFCHSGDGGLGLIGEDDVL